MTVRRVFVSAYEYHPQGVSEALTAYQLAAALRRLGRRVLVVTRATVNKPPWYATARVRCVIPKWPSLWAPNYIEFAVRSAIIARRLAGRIGVAHHVTPISLRTPSLLGSCAAPFVWGPVGGSIPMPKGFDSYERGSGLVGALRRLDYVRLRGDPSLIYTMSRADRLVLTSSMAAEMVPDRYRHKTIVIPEGINDDAVAAVAPGENPYILVSGRLVAYKAIDLAIKAFARLRNSDGVRLLITGDGPLRSELAALVERLGLRKRVEMRGRVPRVENQRLMRGALCCVFPALREAFGHVNLEAMAAWKPIVVTDWGGPRDLVIDGQTGFKVLGRDPDEHVEMLASSTQRLLDDASLRRQFGVAAARRVSSEYAWSTLAQKYHQLYTELGA